LLNITLRKIPDAFGKQSVGGGGIPIFKRGFWPEEWTPYLTDFPLGISIASRLLLLKVGAKGF
jgi:hypothetical protein